MTDSISASDSSARAALAKATGRAAYASDICPEGALVGLVVRSPYPHCLVHGIDSRGARALPGVRAVLTAADIPGKNLLGKTVFDQPVLVAERSRSVLDALALVAADSLPAAQAAAAALAMDLEPLPAVFSVAEALAPGAPQVHPGGNLVREYHLHSGEVAAGLRAADVILEGDYYTPPIEHAYLEPDAGAAQPLPGGRLRIWVGCHSAYRERQVAADTLGIPEENVEICQPYTGGSFGGKDDGLVTAFLALLAWHTGRPVRLAFTRSELSRSHTKRHPQQISVRMGASRDGHILAAAYHIDADTGAYVHWGEGILLFASIGAPGPYRIPNLSVDTRLVYTNNVPFGAMRGWGMPAVTFATESHLDRLAAALDIHPLRLRWLNAAREGDRIITGQKLPPGVGIRDTLAAAARDLGIELTE